VSAIIKDYSSSIGAEIVYLGAFYEEGNNIYSGICCCYYLDDIRGVIVTDVDIEEMLL
jgi:hypothetical protein